MQRTFKAIDNSLRSVEFDENGVSTEGYTVNFIVDKNGNRLGIPIKDANTDTFNIIGSDGKKVGTIDGAGVVNILDSKGENVALGKYHGICMFLYHLKQQWLLVI